MKILGYLILVAMLFVSCEKKKGAITGNVYWEYNKYVGNRPDAGASVIAIGLERDTFKTVCDLSGNFKLDNLPIGKYLVFVISKNTNMSAVQSLQKLMIYATFIERYVNVELFDYAKSYDDLSIKELEYQNSVGLNEKDFDKKMKAYFNYTDSLFEVIPDGVKRLTHIQGRLSPKIEIHELEVKDKEETKLVVDFGNTYM